MCFVCRNGSIQVRSRSRSRSRGRGRGRGGVQLNYSPYRSLSRLYRLCDSFLPLIVFTRLTLKSVSALMYRIDGSGRSIGLILQKVSWLDRRFNLDVVRRSVLI